MSFARRTQDHEKIRKWVEKRGGVPAMVKAAEDDNDEDIGLLRIKFDADEDDLEEIEWEEFFDAFDERQLDFLYQDDSRSEDGRFFKFLNS